MSCDQELLCPMVTRQMRVVFPQYQQKVCLLCPEDGAGIVSGEGLLWPGAGVALSRMGVVERPMDGPEAPASDLAPKSP